MRLLQNFTELNDICPRAYEFIKQHETDIQPGKYDLGDGIRANVDSYQTKNRGNCSYESHRKYVDIQCLLKGAEIISVIDTGNLEADIEYDSEKDITFYKPHQGGRDYLVESGKALVLLPEDAHMPCISCNQGTSTQVLKIVFKVPVEIFHQTIQ